MRAFQVAEFSNLGTSSSIVVYEFTTDLAYTRSS